MDPLVVLASASVGAALGAAAAWIAASSRTADAERARADLAAEAARLAATLDAERRASQAQLSLLDEAREKLGDTLRATSAEALQQSQTSFLHLAEVKLRSLHDAGRVELERREQAVADLVAPVRASLEKVDGQLAALEVVREGAYATLRTQVGEMQSAQADLRAETARLVTALRAPAVRGRWGEVQLRRVVELAGMTPHCDFEEQPSYDTDDGRLRPDLVVHLPGDRHVVVDAKAPLAAYLEALEAPDDATRRARMLDHARQIRAHITTLGRKAYGERVEGAPAFVVLFLPGEVFFSAALEHDPTLLETAIAENVILATPTTLIALLRAVDLGWRQERLDGDARAIRDLGRELYERLAKLGGHFAKVGRELGSAVEAYNAAVGSLESRVLPSARKLRDLGAAPAHVELDVIAPVDTTPRALAAAELVGDAAKNGE